MFNKITSFRIDKDNIEILDNELVKTASEMILPDGHQYDPDFVYMKVRAVSAGEYWGCNKNADFFPEEELKKNYKTFFDAHVFKNHENKEVEKAIGDVLDATWNDEMKYVELFIRVDKRIAPTIARGFEKGFMTDVSMGCKIDHSICSICGNLAKTQSQYCDHIKYEKHKVRDDGKKVYEININPRFHDISAVLNGADRTAKMTGLFISGTKVAYHEEESLEKCASTLEESLAAEFDMEKEAFFGIGTNIVRAKNGLGIDVGIPYGVSVNMSFGEDSKTRTVVGAGFTGPHIGMSFLNPDARKDKDKEALERKLEKEEINRRLNSNKKILQKTAASIDLFDSVPLFEKTASTKVTKKASELEKIAEIKKRIKGNILAVANSRAELAEKERISEAAQEIRMNGTVRPLSVDAMNRFADGINRLSDTEEIMAEQVLTTALKMLSLAGVNLTPPEFVHIMRRVIGIQQPKVVRTCPGHVNVEKMVSVYDGSVDRARRAMAGTSLPTMFNILKSVAGKTLPVLEAKKPSIPAMIVIRKVASCDGIARPELPGLNLEDKVLKLASEIIEERSLHLPQLTKRAMEAEYEAEMEKEADMLMEEGTICSKCGHDRNVNDDKYCPNCGDTKTRNVRAMNKEASFKAKVIVGAGLATPVALGAITHKQVQNKKKKEAKEWLDKHFPGHEKMMQQMNAQGGGSVQVGDKALNITKEASIIDHYYDYLATPTEKIASEDVYEAIERQAYGVYQNLIADYIESREFGADLYKFANEIGIDNESMEKCAKNITKSINAGVGALLYGRYQNVKAREGAPMNSLNRTIAENPELTAIGTFLATKGALNNADKIKNGTKKAIRYIAKRADENMSIYLGDTIEDMDLSEDLLQDIDIFKDNVIMEKMAKEYTPKQIELIKTASIMYAQDRQDLCDNLLSIEGLGYDSVNNFLQICEDTLFEELEKKASIGKAVSTVVGAATKAVGKLGAKAKPFVNKAMTGAKNVGSQAATAFNNNATPGMKSAVNKAGTKMKGLGENINSMNTASKIGLGASVTGTGIGVANLMNNKKKQQPLNNNMM